MKRMENESFEDYKQRRKSLNDTIKNHLKGHYIFKHPMDELQPDGTFKKSKKSPYRKEET